MLASLGFGNPVLPGFWVGKGFVDGEGWGYNLFLEADGRLTRKCVQDWGVRFRLVSCFLTNHIAIYISNRYEMVACFEAKSVWDGKPSFVLYYAGQVRTNLPL